MAGELHIDVSKRKVTNQDPPAVPYAMPTTPMARKSLRLTGGRLTFNSDEECRALERFLGTEQVIEITVYGTVVGAGVSHGDYTITFLVCDHGIDCDELTRTRCPSSPPSTEGSRGGRVPLRLPSVPADGGCSSVTRRSTRCVRPVPGGGGRSHFVSPSTRPHRCRQRTLADISSAERP